MPRPRPPMVQNGLAEETATSRVKHYCAELAEALKLLPHLQIGHAVEVLLAAYRQERTVFLFGNGGSAALASHLACDLAKGTAVDDTRRFRVLSLADNVPLMTAWANDARYDDIFAEQLRNFVQPKDVAFAISGSGNSPNVLNGLQAAREAGAFTIALTGFRGGKAILLADLSIIIPSDDMQHIEDLHLTVAHSIFRAVRQAIEELAPEQETQARAAKCEAD